MPVARRIAPGAHAWDDDWAAAVDPAVAARVLEYYRRDGVVRGALRRHLPAGGRVLEAGCGIGQWVAILAEDGFRAVGIDRSRPGLAAGRRA